MKYQELIKQSINHFNTHRCVCPPVNRSGIFDNGGLWMLHRLQELDNTKRDYINPFSFHHYGCFKYGICVAAFLSTLYLCFQFNWYLTPLAILVFYWFEVHFLFLFPLLIDGAERPILESVKQTYKVGVLRSMVTVIPIAAYMLGGLLNSKNRFYNWHIGCLAILVWYNNEVRSRI